MKDKEFLKQNTLFSKIQGIELQRLILHIIKTKLQYRTSLNIPENITFGLEIEYENMPKIIVDLFIKNLHKNWNSKKDGTVTTGGEISSPIMIDKKIYWQELKEICNFLKFFHANTMNNSGGHIHIAPKQILGENILYWRVFLKIYAIYEPILFRFFYNDKISYRSNISRYALPISSLIKELKDKINSSQTYDDLFQNLPLEKFLALNFSNLITVNNRNNDTLEFRSPNGTIEAVIWQNNINTIAKLLISATKDIDEDYLNYVLDNMLVEDNYNMQKNIHYNEIDITKSLQFIDLIFDNNLDKIYFLIQYFKSFANNYGIERNILARKFY